MCFKAATQIILLTELRHVHTFMTSLILFYDVIKTFFFSSFLDFFYHHGRHRVGWMPFLEFRFRIFEFRIHCSNPLLSPPYLSGKNSFLKLLKGHSSNTRHSRKGDRDSVTNKHKGGRVNESFTWHFALFENIFAQFNMHSSFLYWT